MDDQSLLILLLLIFGAILLIAVIAALKSKKEKAEVKIIEHLKSEHKEEKSEPEKEEPSTAVDIYEYRNTERKWQCPSCGTENWPKAVFCDTCGKHR